MPHGSRPLGGALLCFVSLGLLLCLVPPVLALDVYRTSPGIQIASPVGLGGYLELVDANLTLLLAPPVNNFTLQILTRFGQSSINTKTLPLVILYGQVFFTVAQQILFTFFDITRSSCNDNGGAPPLCPHLQQQMTGPWTFGYQLSANGSSTASLGILDSGSTASLSFLGAKEPFTFVCTSVACSPLSAQVPPSRLPTNGAFTVCAGLRVMSVAHHVHSEPKRQQSSCLPGVHYQPQCLITASERTAPQYISKRDVYCSKWTTYCHLH